MSDTLPPTIPGVFANGEDAAGAVEDLRAAGFDDAHIGVAVPEPGRYTIPEDREGDELKGVAKGVAAGAPIGAIAGMALMALVVPGVGALGVGGALIAGGTGGAVWGTFIGAMSGFIAKVKLGDYEDQYCEIPLAGSDALVVVSAGQRAALARDIMQRHGAKCFMDETHREP